MNRTSHLVSLQLLMLSAVGVWRSDGGSKFWRFIRLFCFFFISGAFILSMFAASFTFTEFSKVVISPLYTYNSLLVVLKATIVYNKAGMIEKFLIEADKVPFFAEPDENQRRRIIVRRIKLLPKVLGALFAFGVVFMITEPLLRDGITNNKCQIFPTWYPFRTEGEAKRCLGIYLFESSAAVYILIVAVGTDALVACLLFIAGGQFESLGFRLKNLPKDNERQWRIKFKQCVEDYKNICGEYERMFSGMLFIQASSSCLFICVSAYALQLAPDTGTIVRFLCFMCSMAYQVFLPCYVGDDILDKSEKLQFDLYSSCWPDIPQGCRKMVLIFSLKLQYPMVIRFGLIQSLRLDTFSKIVNIAYKLYALLQQVPE